VKRVFLCSPYRGDVERNLVVARRAAREIVLAGDTVCAGHLLFPQFLDDDVAEEREAGLRAALSWLPLCDEVLVVGDRTTEGMRRELADARAIGLRVRRLP